MVLIFENFPPFWQFFRFFLNPPEKTKNGRNWAKMENENQRKFLNPKFQVFIVKNGEMKRDLVFQERQGFEVKSGKNF